MENGPRVRMDQLTPEQVKKLAESAERNYKDLRNKAARLEDPNQGRRGSERLRG
jgi:hypothetical protein